MTLAGLGGKKNTFINAGWARDPIKKVFNYNFLVIFFILSECLPTPPKKGNNIYKENYYPLRKLFTNFFTFFMLLDEIPVVVNRSW